MQTFLPFPCFNSSVKALDNKRLGKQRVEGKQILDILENRSPSSRWRNHPAVKMWRGYENALKFYINCCIEEWTSRTNEDGVYFKNTMEVYAISKPIEYPWWFGKEKFHEAHRSNLLRKDYSFYSKYCWQEPTNLPYIWPEGKQKGK